MRCRWLLALYALFFAAAVHSCFAAAETGSSAEQGTEKTELVGEAEKFIPTHEWQEVGPDQAIPPGLHVRLDFQTGKREAKLLDTADQLSAKNHGAMVMVDEGKGGPDDGADVVLSPSQLFDKVQNEHHNFRVKHWSPEAVQSVQESVQKLGRDGIALAELHQALEALEDDVHDIQRAGMFMAAGGVRKVLGLVGNVEQDAEVRLKAAKVLGSAVQSNPDLQLHAMDEGALATLIEQLRDTAATERLQGHSAAFAQALTYAVSAVVRNNPRAQKQLLDGADVLPTLAVLFDHDELGEPVQSRILTVLTDVLEEQAAGHDALLGRLATEGWCHRLKRYLRNAVALDTSQKALKALHATLDACGNVYSHDQGAMDQIQALSKAWQDEAQEVEPGSDWAEYLMGLHELADLIYTEASKCNSSHPCNMAPAPLRAHEEL